MVTKEYLEYLPLEVLEAGIKSVSTLKLKLVMDKALYGKKKKKKHYFALNCSKQFIPLVNKKVLKIKT